MAVAGLGSMCNVAKLCAQTVMRADGLLPCLANAGGWRTSCAEVPGMSSKSERNNTHEQLNCAVNHQSLVSCRSKSSRCGNQNHWQLQQTYQNMFNRRAVREHHPCLRASLFFVVLDRGIKIVSLAPQAWQRSDGRSATPATQSATPATQSDGRCRQVPRLPRKVKSMSPSATPATQTARATTAPNGTQARHRSQPSAISATPATQSDDLCREVRRLPSRDGRCRPVPRRPRKRRRRPRHQTRPKRVRASPVPQVPHLPHKVTIYVAKCHACHAE